MNKKIESRVGVYTLECTKCKTSLELTTIHESWWWKRLKDNKWHYREHFDDDGLLDLRGFDCACKVSNRALYWIWHRERETSREYKLTIVSDSNDYHLEQLQLMILEYASVRHLNITLE